MAVVRNIQLMIVHARPKPRAVLAAATRAAIRFAAPHPMVLQQAVIA